MYVFVRTYVCAYGVSQCMCGMYVCTYGVSQCMSIFVCILCLSLCVFLHFLLVLSRGKFCVSEV